VEDALPEVRYARSGDVEIAYMLLGSGSVDLVLVMGWLTNLEVYWEEPCYRRFVQRLAGFTRLILFDKRGMGLSDRTRLARTEGFGGASQAFRGTRSGRFTCPDAVVEPPRRLRIHLRQPQAQALVGSTAGCLAPLAYTMSSASATTTPWFAH
jgi:pimeloyl-ACP methyl ester carboxylesterase